MNNFSNWLTYQPTPSSKPSNYRTRSQPDYIQIEVQFWPDTDAAHIMPIINDVLAQHKLNLVDDDLNILINHQPAEPYLTVIVH